MIFYKIMSWHVWSCSNWSWRIWLNLKQLLQNALCNLENYVVIHRFCQWYRHFQSSSVGSTIFQLALHCWEFWRCFIGICSTLKYRSINFWMRKTIGSIFLKKILKTCWCWQKNCFIEYTRFGADFILSGVLHDQCICNLRFAVNRFHNVSWRST